MMARFRLKLTVSCEYEVEDTDYLEDGILEHIPDLPTILDVERDFLDEDIQYALDIIENDRRKRKITVEKA